MFEIKPKLKPKEIRAKLEELDSRVIFYPEIEKALIGVVRQFHYYLPLYDYDKALEALHDQFKEDGEEEPWDAAHEWLEGQTLDAWYGDHTPLFIKTEQFSEEMNADEFLDCVS